MPVDKGIGKGGGERPASSLSYIHTHGRIHFIFLSDQNAPTFSLWSPFSGQPTELPLFFHPPNSQAQPRVYKPIQHFPVQHTYIKCMELGGKSWSL